MRPMGGFFGAADGNSAVQEHQRGGSPHVHGKVYVVSAYQYRPLSEIAQLIEDELIDMHDLEVFQSWVMREEHFDQEDHEKNIESLESQWPDYSAEEH